MADHSEAEGLIEPEHVVPTHLNTPDRVGPLTVRQLNMLLGPTLFASPGGWALGHQVGAGIGVGGELGVAAAAVPILFGAAAALPLEPPIEHGLRKLLEYRVRPRTIGTAQMAAFTRIKEAGTDGVLRMSWKRECRAVWRLPTTNLRLAHTLQKQTAVRRWARFL
ncbi:MAG: hypothetical protein JO352_13070, partial [Chloroflexi bacterium]|nr:hypothetical protein [Chloroflexota bacterium]